MFIVIYLVKYPRIKVIHMNVCVYIQEVTETPSISAERNSRQNEMPESDIATILMGSQW